MLYLAVLIVSIIAGFGTGLLGIGGGIVIFPSFMFILPALGLEAFSINTITGIASMQILMSSFFAFLSHRKLNVIDKKDLYLIGASAAFGSFSGAVSSAYFSQKVLLSMYLLILIIAFYSMFTKTVVNDENENNSNEKKHFLVRFLLFGTGILAGALGLGGSVLYVPILRKYYKISTKLCISSTTFIVFCGAAMGFAGKMITGQVPYHLLIFTVFGSFIGAKAGSLLCRRLSSAILKKLLMGIIIISAIRVMITILQ